MQTGVNAGPGAFPTQMPVTYSMQTGVNAGPGAFPTQMPVAYSMQTASVQHSSAGQPAPSLYSNDPVQVETNYPHPLPRETSACYVQIPPPPVRRAGMF